MDSKTREAVKEQVYEILKGCAKIRKMTTYSELASKITATQVGPWSLELFQILGEISESEVQNGRPMLSALVIHKLGDQEPGKGFYELAEELGYEVTDRTMFWINELKGVFAVYAT